MHDTNFSEVVQNQQPYPTKDGNSSQSEILSLIKAGIICSDDKAITLPEAFVEGDLYLSMMNGGAGLGDPLERSIKLIEKDLQAGFVSKEYAVAIYGIEIMKSTGDKNEKVSVDQKKTIQKRESIKINRSGKSIPVSEWLKNERQRVLNKEFIEPVKEMYRSSFSLSKSWKNEFYQFWNLPGDFIL